MNTTPTGSTLSREPDLLYIVDAKALSRYIGVDLVEASKSRTRSRPAATPSFAVILNGAQYDAVVIESLITDETQPRLQEPLALAVIATAGMNDEITEWYTLVTYDKRDPNVTLAPRIIRVNPANVEWLKDNLEQFHSAE